MANNNNTKNLNVPNLRFPEFTGEWKETIFEKICNIATGNKNTQDKKEDGEYPFYVRSEMVERINSYSFNGEAILTAGDGVGVGKVFHYVNGKVGVHQRVYILSNFECSCKFAYYYFSSKFYNRVKRMSAKNSVDSVRHDMIAQMPILLPARHEQNKIAQFLCLLEQRIETQIKIIEDLKLLKSAIRDKLYSALHSNKCISLEIKDILDYEQPTKYIVDKDEYSSDSTLVPVLTANKAFILGYTNENNGIYNKGECIIFDDFTMDSKFVNFPFKVKSSAIKILRTKDNFNTYFIFEYIAYLRLSSEEHKRHYISEIELRYLDIPDYATQLKIASILRCIDKLLTNANRINELYLKQKQYLLSNIFI